MKRNNGASPTDLSQLKSYYNPEAEDEIFKRYELIPNPANFEKGDYLVREIAPSKDSIYENYNVLIGPAGWRRVERK